MDTISMARELGKLIRGDEPTGRALPEDHHEGADHAAELRHPDGSVGL